MLIFRSQESLSALFVAQVVGSCFEGIGSVDGAGADASARVFLARPEPTSGLPEPVAAPARARTTVLEPVASTVPARPPRW